MRKSHTKKHTISASEARAKLATYERRLAEALQKIDDYEAFFRRLKDLLNISESDIGREQDLTRASTCRTVRLFRYVALLPNVDISS